MTRTHLSLAALITFAVIGFESKRGECINCCSWVPGDEDIDVYDCMADACALTTTTLQWTASCTSHACQIHLSGFTYGNAQCTNHAKMTVEGSNNPISVCGGACSDGNWTVNGYIAKAEGTGGCPSDFYIKLLVVHNTGHSWPVECGPNSLLSQIHIDCTSC